MMMFRSGPSVDSIERLARLHLDELEAKGIIKHSGEHNFDSVYTFEMMKAMEYKSKRAWYQDT